VISSGITGRVASGPVAARAHVENGEIVLSMDSSQNTSRVLPMTSMDVQPNRGENTMTIDSPLRRQASVMQVMDVFNSHISARAPQARAKA